MHPNLTAIRAILFDFDETLVPDTDNVVGALEHVIAPLLPGTHLNPRHVAQSLRNHADKLFHQSAHYQHLHMLGVSADEGLWADFAGDDPQIAAARQWVVEAYRPAVWEGLLEALERPADPAFAAQLSQAFYDERRNRGRIPYPDTVSALDTLAPRYAMALVTNGLSDLQRLKVSISGLGPRFGAIIVSGEVGFGKPEPQAFEAAMQALGVGPEAAIMVGDSLERDVLGARAAGIPVVWVNRDGATAPPTATPDYEVADLHGLVELLA